MPTKPHMAKVPVGSKSKRFKGSTTVRTF